MTNETPEIEAKLHILNNESMDNEIEVTTTEVKATTTMHIAKTPDTIQTNRMKTAQSIF